MPPQCTRAFQKFLDLQTNEEYERHFRHLQRDDLLLIFRDYLHPDAIKHIYYSWERGRGERPSQGNVVFAVFLHATWSSVLKAVAAMGDFHMRLGGHPSDS